MVVGGDACHVIIYFYTVSVPQPAGHVFLGLSALTEENEALER
jgi:hypothetical protein